MKLFLHLIGPGNSRVLGSVVEFGSELVLRLDHLDGVVGAAVQDARADAPSTKHDFFGLELVAFKGVLVRYLLFLNLQGPLANSLDARRLQQIDFGRSRCRLSIFYSRLLVFLLTFESDHVVGFELEFVQELLLGGSQAALQILVQGERDLVLDVLPDYVMPVVLRGLSWL